MKIGIDIRIITLGPAGGIAQLIKGVLENMFVLGSEHTFYVFCTIFNRRLLQTTQTNVQFFVLPIGNFYHRLDQIAAVEGIEVLFRSYPGDDSLSFPLSRQIVHIPDIQHEVFPEFFKAEVLRSRRMAFNRVVGEAGAIGTLSDHARSTIQHHEWTRCQDIFLMSPALQRSHQTTEFADLSYAEQALIPQQDFFLFPANLWPHKNHRRVLQAFELFLKHTSHPLEFVFTGHPDGWAEIQALYPALPIRHLGYVRPQVLRLLFEHSRALVFFSLFEGFGIPLLEAFDAATPVICSNTTSLPEVGGDAILSCDPTNIHAMSQLMAQIVEDQELRVALIARGKQQLKRFSWEESSQNLLAACLRVANSIYRPVLDLAPIAQAVGVTHAPINNAPIIQHDELPQSIARTDDLPLVSIVTPSYNQGRFLRRTIESVLNQSYPNIEYFVIDGGSTDESLDILRSYGDRFEWISEPDQGQTHAINKGFARSRGAIRAYLNSDDTIELDAIEKVVAYFQQHPNCDLVYGQANYIDADDQVTGKYHTDTYSFAKLMHNNCICQPAAFWRTRIANRVGSFNEQLHYAMDYEYWLRIDRFGGRIEHLAEVLASSRDYPETKTRSAREEIFQDIFQVCKAQGGYVSRTYFYGLWHYRCWGNTVGWPRRLRTIPGFYQRMGYIHHLWYHNRSAAIKHVLGAPGRRAKLEATTLLYAIGRRAKRLAPAIFAPLAQWVHSRRQVQSVQLVPPFSGFWGDNWFGPSSKIILQVEESNPKFHLAGVAPIDMHLTITVADTVVGIYPLRANIFEEIHFQVDPRQGQQQPAHLTFSEHICDAVQRNLSFLVHDTNLFSENDFHRMVR